MIIHKTSKMSKPNKWRRGDGEEDIKWKNLVMNIPKLALKARTKLF